MGVVGEQLRAQTRRTAPARSAPTTVAGKLIPQPVANLCGTLTNLFPLWVRPLGLVVWERSRLTGLGWEPIATRVEDDVRRLTSRFCETSAES